MLSCGVQKQVQSKFTKNKTEWKSFDDPSSNRKMLTSLCTEDGLILTIMHECSNHHLILSNRGVGRMPKRCAQAETLSIT